VKPTKPINIHQRMTEAELVKLKPRGAKRMVLKLDDEKHPEKEMDADDIRYCAGVNGEVVFK